MSKIEELIERLCPDGVGWKTIQDICKKITSGGTPSTSKAEYYNGTIPWLRTQEVDWTDIYDTGIKISETGLKNSSAKLIPENCVIVAMYGATAAKVAVNKIPLCTNQACCNLEVNESAANYRYVYYWLCNSYNHLRSLGEGSQSNINGQKNKSYQIPIPPLEIQNEIVSILDKFTLLEAELEARKAQYEHYRNALLRFEAKNMEWKTLGEISNSVTSGGTPLANKSEYYSNGTIPWLRTQEVRFNEIYSTEVKITELALKQSSAKWIPANCVIVAISGATAGRSAINKIPLTTNQHCCNLEINPNHANYRYVFHWVSCRYEQLKSLGQGARADLNSGRIKSFPIPVPSLPEQEKIVSILDKFDALVNDISIGIPAEIEARRKQYEYYRNKLLTFKNAAHG